MKWGGPTGKLGLCSQKGKWKWGKHTGRCPQEELGGLRGFQNGGKDLFWMEKSGPSYR